MTEVLLMMVYGVIHGPLCVFCLEKTVDQHKSQMADPRNLNLLSQGTWDPRIEKQFPKL